MKKIIHKILVAALAAGALLSGFTGCAAHRDYQKASNEFDAMTQESAAHDEAGNTLHAEYVATPSPGVISSTLKDIEAWYLPRATMIKQTDDHWFKGHAAPKTLGPIRHLLWRGEMWERLADEMDGSVEGIANEVEKTAARALVDEAYGEAYNAYQGAIRMQDGTEEGEEAQDVKKAESKLKALTARKPGL